MNKIFNDIKTRYQSGDLLTKIIYINVWVYLILVLINLLAPLFTGKHPNTFVEEFIYPWIAFNSDITNFIIKPWTLITHQFVHALSPWHIIGNLLMFYYLGKLFLNYFSQKQLLGLYLLGGILGAIVLLVVANFSPFFPNQVSAIGASAAVMSIAIAVCTYVPKSVVHLFGMFQVKLQWIGLFLIASDVLFFYDGNTGGHLAHLAGAATGFIFIKGIKNGNDYTKVINSIIDKIISFFPNQRQKNNLEVVFNNSSKTRTMNDETYNKTQHQSQEIIDEILDKISKNGYESLSKKEKDTLFRYSKK